MLSVLSATLYACQDTSASSRPTRTVFLYGDSIRQNYETELRYLSHDLWETQSLGILNGFKSDCLIPSSGGPGPWITLFHRDPDVLVNAGIWDAILEVELEMYRENLRDYALWVFESLPDATLVYSTSAPGPATEPYNEVMKEVVNEFAEAGFRIRLHDLYAFIVDMEIPKSSDGLHYTEGDSQILAYHIFEYLTAVFED